MFEIFEIFKKTILGKKFFILSMFVLTLLFILMYISLFPTVQKNAENYTALMNSFPKSMLEIFGMEDQLSFTKLENYINIELFSFMWPIMSVILALVFGMGAIAGEVENGTMEILLSLPISRTKIIISKIFAGLLVLLVYSFISAFGIVLFAIILNIDYQLANYFYLFIGCFIFIAAIFAISVFFSAAFSDRGKGAMLTTGLILFMYVLNVLSTLRENLTDLKYVSFFYYFNASEILSKKLIRTESLFVFGSVFALSLIAAIWIFNKRDISV